jgi:hypothetical protein
MGASRDEDGDRNVAAPCAVLRSNVARKDSSICRHLPSSDELLRGFDHTARNAPQSAVICAGVCRAVIVIRNRAASFATVG